MQKREKDRDEGIDAGGITRNIARGMCCRYRVLSDCPAPCVLSDMQYRAHGADSAPAKILHESAVEQDWEWVCKSLWKKGMEEVRRIFSQSLRAHSRKLPLLLRRAL